MGDVVMKKYDSGTNSATGLTGSGVRDWIVQRVSAVVLGIYSVVLLGYFMFAEVTFETWYCFMSCLPMKLFSLVAILALAGHSWVGIWTIFTDYVTASKLGPAASGLRLVLQALMIISVFAFLFWGVMIFWSL